MNTDQIFLLCKTVSKQSAKVLLILGSVITGGEVHAGIAPLCSATTGDSSIATTSIYYVPHIKDHCPGTEICQKFRDLVRKQGSGTLYDGKTLKYNGDIVDIGDCNTARGASGECLIPYVSIAADLSRYEVGDIIEMPHLKGLEIKLPNGKTMIHPGYLRVDDSGSDIVGRGRFDVFTGSAGPKNADNVFGYGKPTSLSETGQCIARKSYSLVEPGALLDETQAMIANMGTELTSNSGTMIAGSNAGVK